MKITELPDKARIENEVFEKFLTLDNKHILELGCGRADLTRLLATGGDNRIITATEVDKTQHDLNLKIDDLPNVRFLLAGAEDIPLADSSVDLVFMFKSLHHVPVELMDSAFKEINRVLKPDGKVYISEPVFSGALNDVLRMFHDEEKVRAAAYSAIGKAADSDSFVLTDEILFSNIAHFKDFEDFERKVINVTHTDHQLSPQLREKVATEFNKNMDTEGAQFLSPNRVNILQKC